MNQGNHVKRIMIFFIKRLSAHRNSEINKKYSLSNLKSVKCLDQFCHERKEEKKLMQNLWQNT